MNVPPDDLPLSSFTAPRTPVIELRNILHPVPLIISGTYNIDEMDTYVTSCIAQELFKGPVVPLELDYSDLNVNAADVELQNSTERDPSRAAVLSAS